MEKLFKVPILNFTKRQKFFLTYSILLLLTLIGFIVRQYQFPGLSKEDNIFMFLFSFGLITLMWNYFNGMNQLLNRIYPYERSVSGRIMIQILFGVVFIILCRVAIYIWIEPLVPIEITSLFRYTTYILYVLLSILFNLIFFSSYFFQQWSESIKKAERLEREKTQVQFDNLKNQLNPHFLFNSLTSLNSLIFENPHLASDFLQNLSKVFRYVLQNKEKNLVSLSTELSFIQNYIFLLKTRFQNAIIIDIHVNDTEKEKMVVPVTLQILIENAVKHNSITESKPLKIEVLTENGYIKVKNNKQFKKQIENSNKVGIRNMKNLYSFYSTKMIEINEDAIHYEISVPLIGLE